MTDHKTVPAIHKRCDENTGNSAFLFSSTEQDSSITHTPPLKSFIGSAVHVTQGSNVRCMQDQSTALFAKQPEASFDGPCMDAQTPQG